jgi:hypothetical protein
MVFGPVIIQAQINLVEACGNQIIHVCLIDHISVCLQRDDKTIGFCPGDNFKEVAAERRFAPEQIDDQTSRQPEVLKE